jgi:hypothetical protein
MTNPNPLHHLRFTRLAAATQTELGRYIVIVHETDDRDYICDTCGQDSRYGTHEIQTAVDHWYCVPEADDSDAAYDDNKTESPKD